MLYCRMCKRYPCDCGEYEYVRDGSEGIAYCPNDGNVLAIQTEDRESTIFAACPHCRNEWERFADGSFVVFEEDSTAGQ